MVFKPGEVPSFMDHYMIDENIIPWITSIRSLNLSRMGKKTYSVVKA